MLTGTKKKGDWGCTKRLKRDKGSLVVIGVGIILTVGRCSQPCKQSREET